MNTTRILHFDPARIARYAEVGLYTALAGVLLARALLHPGSLTFEDSLLMILGTVFGLMVSCAADPGLRIAVAPARGQGSALDRQCAGVPSAWREQRCR